LERRSSELSSIRSREWVLVNGSRKGWKFKMQRRESMGAIGTWMNNLMFVLSFHVAGDFDLEQIRQMGDEQPHLVAEGPVGDGERRSMDRQCMWAAFRASMIKLRSLSGLHQAMPSSVKVQEGSAREEWA
jgi:hypothetical protein